MNTAELDTAIQTLQKLQAIVQKRNQPILKMEDAQTLAALYQAITVLQAEKITIQSKQRSFCIYKYINYIKNVSQHFSFIQTSK